MTLKWTDEGENINVNRDDLEGVTDFERDYVAPWTEESQTQFDEQVAGLPETVHGRVRMLAQDQANFQLGSQVSREDIADAVESVLKDPVAAGSDYQRYQSEPEFEEEPAWEPAWERDAVMELLRLISVSPQWLTADGAKVLIDAAKDRCGANNGDLVEESDVREAFDALS